MDRLLTETELILMLTTENIIEEFEDKDYLGNAIDKLVNHTKERQDARTARLVAKEIIEIVDDESTMNWVELENKYPDWQTKDMNLAEYLEFKYGVKDENTTNNL